MHVELRAHLQELSREWAASRGLGLGRLRSPVETCPYPEEGDLSSPIVFELVRIVPDVSPEVIAQQLIERHERSTSRSFFRIVSAGGGYLNTAVLDPFIGTFLSRIGATPAGVTAFFDVESFVVAPSVVNLDSGNAPAAFAAHWEMLWQAAREHREEDVRGFAKLRSESEKKEDRLMLLALLGDDELEAAPYLSGLAGRQNIPWYIKRFFHDAERALEFWCTGEQSADTWRAPMLELRSYWIALLTVRSKFLCAYRREHDGASVALTAALDLVRQFYTFFNNPRFRQLSAQAEPSQQLGACTAVTRELLRSVLKALPLAPIS